MTEPTTILAAAWRARVADGRPCPVTIERTPRGWVIRVHGTRVARHAATYKAHAHAERLARHYDHAP